MTIEQLELDIEMICRQQKAEREYNDAFWRRYQAARQRLPQAGIRSTCARIPVSWSRRVRMAGGRGSA